MTLNDIRKKSGLMLIVIGGAMAAFILTDFFKPEQWQNDPSVVLEVDGKEFTYQELDNELVQVKTYFYGGIIPQGRETVEQDKILDNYIEDVLFLEKFEESSIIVTEKELDDLASGQHTGIVNQASLFKQYFSALNESGVATTDDIIAFLDDVKINNKLAYTGYLYLRDQVGRTRNIEKYKNAIKKGLHATTIDAKASYVEKNQKMNGQYIYLPCNSSTLSDFDPSDKEIKNYYKKNKEDFINNNPGRELTYFIFDCVPSSEDSLSYIDNFNDLKTDFIQTNELEEFVNINSDTPYKIVKLTQEEYNNLIQDKIVNNNIITPYFEQGLCKMGRVLELEKDSVGVVYLEILAEPSDATVNEVYANLKDIIYQNSKIEDIKEFTKTNNIGRPRTVDLEKTDKNIPGLSGNNRNIIQTLFNESTQLNEPQSFEVAGDKYILAIISKISEDEYQKLDDVKDEIESILITNDNIRIRVNEISNSNYKSIEDLATKFNISVKNVSQLSMDSDNFGNEGYQPDIVGAFFSSQNLTPVIAQKGVFVFDNTNKKSITLPEDFSVEMKSLDRQYQTEVDLLLLDVLKEDKNIIDNRFNFY